MHTVKAQLKYSLHLDTTALPLPDPAAAAALVHLTIYPVLDPEIDLV